MFTATLFFSLFELEHREVPLFLDFRVSRKLKISLNEAMVT